MLFTGNCLELMMLIVSVTFTVLWSISRQSLKLMLADLFFLYRIKSRNKTVMNFLYEVFGKRITGRLLVLVNKYDIIVHRTFLSF